VTVRVIVDRNRCEGNEFCVRAAPKVFELDDDEYAVVILDPIPDDQIAAAEQAIADCPRAALSRAD
jgi:ferredoxin